MCPRNNAVLDGMRHEEVLDALIAKTATNDVLLVLVEASVEALTERHRQRGNDYEVVRAGPAEQQVMRELKSRANLVVDGEASVF